MANILPYLLMPVMEFLLVIAQTLWASVIKTGHALQGSLPTIALNLASNWKMWLGAMIYIIATLVYFYMLSKLKFFSVQIAMTALSIIFSTSLSILIFNERPTLINIAGAVIVLAGIFLVLYKS
jgi:drug/metabolite transporter (DMT)-like permease